MTTTTQFMPILLTGDGVTDRFPLALSGSNLTAPATLKISLIFPDPQSTIDMPLQAIRRLATPADYLILGDAVTGYTLDLVSPPGIDERVIVDRVEPALSPNRLRDGPRFPAADTESNLNRLARAGQDAGRMASLAVRLSPIDAIIDPELPPLPDSPVLLVVERGQRPRMISAVNVEKLASRADDVTAVAQDEILEALRITATADAQSNLQAFVDDRANIDTVAGEIGRVRIVADPNVRALMANATDPANLTTYGLINANRVTYQTVADIRDQVSQLASDTTRAAVNALGAPDMIGRLTNLDARRTAIDNLDDRRTALDTLSSPATLAKIDAVTDPVTLSQIGAVNADRVQILTVANIASRVTALTQPVALAGVVELSTPENMATLRTVQLNGDNVRRVGSNIADVRTVSDNVDEIIFTPTAIANAMRGADEIIRDQRLTVVLRNAEVITDRRSESPVAPRVIDKMNGNEIRSANDPFQVTIFDKGHAA